MGKKNLFIFHSSEVIGWLFDPGSHAADPERHTLAYHAVPYHAGDALLD